MKKPSSSRQSPSSKLPKQPRVALVADWLTQIGGAEQVVLALHQMYPDAPIYTSQYDPQKMDWFKDADVRTTWLQKLPKSLRKFIPVLRAIAFKRLDLSDYDIVISSSGAEAKYVNFGRWKMATGRRRRGGQESKRPGMWSSKASTSYKKSPTANYQPPTTKTLHISYIHAPTHYYWARYDQYMEHPGFGKLNWLARLGLKILVGPLRKLDYKMAQKPDVLLANSTHTQNMIKKYYDRDSTIVFPPVQLSNFQLPTSNPPKTRSGFVAIGRQVPYKNIHLAVLACSKLNLPLTVVGNGPEHENLVKIAGKTVSFPENVTDPQKISMLQTSKGLIFPNCDDFGITAVEALAAGTPVIALRAGGALDWLQESVNGVFFEAETAESLEAALKDFEKLTFDSGSIKKSVEKFSKKEFKKNIAKVVEDNYEKAAN